MRQTFVLEQEDRNDAMGPGGSRWQHTDSRARAAGFGQEPLWNVLPASCTLGSLLHEPGPVFPAGVVIACLFPVPVSLWKASDSWICAACLGTGDITSTRNLLLDLRNSPVIFNLGWLSNKNHLNFTLSQVKRTGNFKAAMPGPSAIQTHLSKVFLPVSLEIFG